jgi:hypothetical protein
MLFVLVSGSFQTIDTPHGADTFGQQVEMPEDLAASAILSGASLLPKDAFDSCGFSTEEIAAWPNARMQANAPAPFHAKHAKALQAVREYREKLSRQNLTPLAQEPGSGDTLSADKITLESSSGPPAKSAAQDTDARGNKPISKSEVKS